MDLIRRIRDFNYGVLNSQKKPSRLQIERNNLGQNASQLYVIMVNMPFIFVDKKSELHRIWPLMVSLLNCMRIIFSYKITENDLDTLTEMSEEHLSGMIACFNVKLKPKQHNLTHYPTVIRQMGPLKLMWMMKFESKHKYFTSIAKKTNNFINLTKTLAENHQSYICWKQSSYNDEIEMSKKFKLFTECADFSLFQSILEKNNLSDLDNSKSLKFLKVNGITYRKGIMLINENSLFEIVFVLNKNDEYFLIGHRYKVIRFVEYLNSFEIEKLPFGPENIQIIEVLRITNHEVLEKKIALRSIYIIADTLEIFRSLS